MNKTKVVLIFAAASLALLAAARLTTAPCAERPMFYLKATNLDCSQRRDDSTQLLLTADRDPNAR